MTKIWLRSFPPIYPPSHPRSSQTLGPLLSVNICRYRFFFFHTYTYVYTCIRIHKYIYRPPSCPKVCQTVGPFPISEFARLRSFTFHHPPRVCQTLSSYKSFHHHFFFWSIIDALPCSLIPIKGSGCHPLARCMGVDRCGERFFVLCHFLLVQTGQDAVSGSKSVFYYCRT